MASDIHQSQRQKSDRSEAEESWCKQPWNNCNYRPQNRREFEGLWWYWWQWPSQTKQNLEWNRAMGMEVVSQSSITLGQSWWQQCYPQTHIHGLICLSQCHVRRQLQCITTFPFVPYTWPRGTRKGKPTTAPKTSKDDGLQWTMNILLQTASI